MANINESRRKIQNEIYHEAFGATKLCSISLFQEKFSLISHIIQPQTEKKKIE